MDREFLEKEVRRLGERQPWWHDIELPYGVHTCERPAGELRPNHNVVKWNKIRQFVELKNKKVIDLGCNEGFFCIQAHREGAAKVLGVDVNGHRIEKARFVLEALGLPEIQLLQESIFKLDESRFNERFDVCFSLGLLHRVTDPFTLISISGRIAETAVFEWSAVLSELPLMTFRAKGFKEYDPDNSGYWRPSRRCVMEMLWRCGFKWCRHIEEEGHRAILIASTTDQPRAPEPSEWISLQSVVDHPMESRNLLAMGQTATMFDKLIRKIRRRLNQ